MDNARARDAGASTRSAAAGATTAVRRSDGWDSVPRELKARRAWVCWRRESRNGKVTKVPYDPTTGRRAKSNDPSTWTDFETALGKASEFDGLGIMLGGGLCGIDLDHCRDPGTGEIQPRAREAVAQLDSEIGVAALTYVERGWAVLPVRGKRPRTRHGVRDATLDAAQVRAWWRTWPKAGVAIATGAASGLVVVDVDGQDGLETLQELERQHGPLPETVAVTTGGGGLHFYFKHPGGDVRGRLGLLPGLDVKADGGYVVAPPSLHPNGRRYAWEVMGHPDDVEVAEAPAWLMDLVRSPSRGDRAVQEQTIPRGRRNITLTSIAGAMRADGATQEQMLADLVEVNERRCEEPLPERELSRIAASVARYPPGASGQVVRIPKTVLRRGLSPGALTLYMARQALRQVGERTRQVDLARVLGVHPQTVQCWRAELSRANLDVYERPSRRFVRMPVAIVLDPEVPVTGKVVAVHLAALVDDTGIVRVGLDALRCQTGFAEKTLRRHLKSLAEQGHLRITRARFNADLGRRERTNRYTVLALRPQGAQGLTPKNQVIVTDREQEAPPIKSQRPGVQYHSRARDVRVSWSRIVTPTEGAVVPPRDRDAVVALAVQQGLPRERVEALIEQHGMERVRRFMQDMRPRQSPGGGPAPADSGAAHPATWFPEPASVLAPPAETDDGDEVLVDGQWVRILRRVKRPGREEVKEA